MMSQTTPSPRTAPAAAGINTDNRPVAVVVGVGPGIGGSVAIEFASHHYAIALMSRSITHLTPIEQTIKQQNNDAIVLSVPCDVTSEKSIQEAFQKVRDELGHVDILIYNAAQRRFKPIFVHDAEVSVMEHYWRVNCLGAFIAVKQVLPAMMTKKQGTILLTGATGGLRGSEGQSTFAVSKFGLRALGQSLSREYHKMGIHVVHVIIEGAVDSPLLRDYVTKRLGGKPAPDDLFLDPKEIAKQYWNLHAQHRSVWTQELDLRPWGDTIFSKL